jgi:hypothetical protein
MSVVRSSGYKAQPCQNMLEEGFCRYGNQCQFAHSRAELERAATGGDGPFNMSQVCLLTSVEYPDPHAFGPPESGSGSISQRYGSGSFPFLINVLSLSGLK